MGVNSRSELVVAAVVLVSDWAEQSRRASHSSLSSDYRSNIALDKRPIDSQELTGCARKCKP